MHVILTHEQADFDAMGALLGAHLLQENHLAILPRKTNRNVHAFLSLYGADLPFVDLRELPAEPVETILLVDTQSLITIKGITGNTRVRVIDHHPPREDAPETWSIHSDPLGAITTLFVEGILENGIALTPVQASLLLLGIYEDTGSLSYASTTPRDVRAAAFVLEQGANLSAVGRYLNPPLSPEQRKVYDRLLASAQSLLIHGQRVVIACGSAEDMHEEVSSIAHKLRDLLDPDALFMMVTTVEGVRLVARSMTNRINVAEVAGEFGGGGHERAAAALIRKVEAETGQDLLDASCKKLVELLPNKIQPAIKVGQIMSSRPHLITPSTSAKEAARMMQRYGYEGFPVVEDRQVVGLLTRRAVDRALSHHLDLTAASLMEAGTVTILPDQSVEHLQQVMTASGWGQVPVVDPVNGDVIGIVTRTDLLKTLAYHSVLPTRQNLSRRLEAALPATRLALLQAVASQAYEQRLAVYIVGGFVRDLLLERPSLDFDLVVEGDAIGLAHALADKFGGQVVSHARFGTAKWSIAPVRALIADRLPNAETRQPEHLPESLDLISARTEFYERPTAMPTVERGSIKLDLHRRDFTFNTLALRLDGRHYGELYDYWGGLSDLRGGLVRVLHSLSFIDDPTRLLRAVRFEQRFNFQIETRTLQLIGEALDMLKQVSGDRLRHELDLILAEPRAITMIPRLASLGILENIHPALPAELPADVPTPPIGAWPLEPRYSGIPTRRILGYLVWLSPLTPSQANEIATRLRFPAALCHMLVQACILNADLPSLVGLPASRIVDRLDNLPLPVLLASHRVAATPTERNLIETYITTWRRLQPKTNGDTLRAMGLPPGPVYQRILTTLKDAWLDGQIHTPEDEDGLLNQLLARQGYN
ncbi:MAG: CBS domain-containing protein [Anaerolineaceae bacterium]|nr:CBS domain-containing protein [Anaerolineaceae bacterium]